MINTEIAPHIPEGLWVRCEECKTILYKTDFEANNYVCTNCSNHFRMSARDRMSLIADDKTFKEFDSSMSSVNILSCPGYESKLEKAKLMSGMNEGVLTGKCRIGGRDAVIVILDSNFMMGSMGSVVGEKITRATEHATSKKLPLVIFSASGGARMQEGIVSLMQMAKTTAALAKHDEAGLLYISVLTDPTTGGVTASFAMVGDIVISEPKALIGFAGPRVIKQTIGGTLPEGFQTAEFLYEHGFIDMITHRHEMKDMLSKLIKMHHKKKGGNKNGKTSS